MAFKQTQTYSLGSAAANGLIGGKTLQIKDFKDCIITITVSGSGVGVLKTYGSIQETKPDFSASASSSNQYSPLQLVNLQNGSFVDGATGIVYTGAGTDGTASYEVNTNFMSWIGFVLSGVSAGTFTATVTLSDNL